MNEIAKTAVIFYETLLEKLQPRLYGYILSLTANPIDAKDILQEANSVILSKLSEFKHPNNFDAWAYKIAYFQSLSYFQKKSKSEAIFSDALMDTIASETESIDSQVELKIQNLEICLSKLSWRARTLVGDYYFENLSIKEIAKKRNLKTNHIAQLLYRARKALFQCITKSETTSHE